MDPELFFLAGSNIYDSCDVEFLSELQKYVWLCFILIINLYIFYKFEDKIIFLIFSLILDALINL